MPQKKYEFVTTDQIKVGLLTLTRIRALIDIPKYNVKAGDLGGYIETQENLSHENSAWVGGDAQVLDGAQVTDNALACGNTQIASGSWVFGNARVMDNTKVFNNARVSGNTLMVGNAWVYDRVHVSGTTWLRGDARVSGIAV